MKKVLSIALAGLLLNLVGSNPAYAESKEEREARFVEKVKEGVRKLGVGEAARVEVRLRDNTRLKGYISEAGDESFVVVDTRTGNATRLTYPQVKGVKGNNHSAGVDVAIGAALIGAIILVTLFFVKQTK